MKYALYALIVVASAGVLFSPSCKKKVDQKNCYTCIDNDSVASNIPSLVNPHFDVVHGNHCGFTDWMKNLYIKQHTYADTVYNRGDTVMLGYHTTSCELM